MILAHRTKEELYASRRDCYPELFELLGQTESIPRQLQIIMFDVIYPEILIHLNCFDRVSGRITFRKDQKSVNEYGYIDLTETFQMLSKKAIFIHLEFIENSNTWKLNENSSEYRFDITSTTKPSLAMEDFEVCTNICWFCHFILLFCVFCLFYVVDC